MLSKTDTKLSIAVFRALRAMGISLAFIEKIEKWANCLFIRFKVNAFRSKCRFLSYRSITNVPDRSGDFYFIDYRTNKRIECTVRINARNEIGANLTVITRDGRIFNFDTYQDRLSRGFDWEGRYIGRAELREYGFEPIPAPNYGKRIDAILSGRKLRIKSEGERVTV